MAPGAEEDDMAWNNDWDDDNDSTGALESQQILQGAEDQGIEDEIQANLNSKIASSVHAYKVAGIALIITLISFTINTVVLYYYGSNDRNSHNMCKSHYIGRNHIVCC